MAAGERPAKGVGPVAGLAGFTAIARRPGGMTCARRLAGARKPASPSRGSPSRPEPRPGRRRARLFGLPALALLLAALGTLAAAPAQAQTTLWSATLTPALISFDTGRGCDDDDDDTGKRCSNTAVLTENEISIRGTNHEIYYISRSNFETSPEINIYLNLGSDWRLLQGAGVTLHIGSTTFALDDADP